MKTTKKLFALVIALVFVLSSLAGCKSNSAETATATTATAAKEPEAAVGEVEILGTSEAAAVEVTAETKFKDEIIIGNAEAVSTLDPSGSTSVMNLIMFWMSHSTLIDVDPLTGEITCDAWQVH